MLRIGILSILFSINTLLLSDDNISLSQEEQKKQNIERWRNQIDAQNDAEIRKRLRDKERERFRDIKNDNISSDQAKQSEIILGKHFNKSRHFDHGKNREIASKTKKEVPLKSKKVP